MTVPGFAHIGRWLERPAVAGQRCSRRRFLASTALLGAAALSRTAPECRAAVSWSDQRTVGPFRCRATFPLDTYDQLLMHLEGLQAELVRALGIRAANRPIDVYLFGNRTSYREGVQHLLPDVPFRRALFVKSGARSEVLAYRHDQFSVDLRHECTHALLHAVLDMVPLWLDEGLAEYFEVPPDQRAYDHPHLALLKWNMRLGILPPLANLEERTEMGEMGILEYRFSWAWVHFMLHGPACVHRQLVAFLADIQASTPPGCLSERLAAAVPAVEQQMIAHFKHWRRG